MNPTVSLGRKVQDMSHGQEWRLKLPDAWFTNPQYGFNFDEIGIVVEGDVFPEYRLYWLPSTLDAAIELFRDMDKVSDNDFMANTDGQITLFGKAKYDPRMVSVYKKEEYGGEL